MNFFVKKFNDFFSFEKGIDPTNETQVLYRKNLVIKNIIFLSNMVYTIMMFLITLGEASTSNVVLTIVLFPFTFLFNKTLKKIIYAEPDNYKQQQIAMYMNSFYMFLSAILIYLKSKSSLQTNYDEAGYILLYYSLIVVALYQDKALMSVVYRCLFIIVTIIHFTLTYSIMNQEYAYSAVAFLKTFFTTPEFKDILIRSIILILFMIALYSNVQISQYMQEQRKTETKKRLGVETDFQGVVDDVMSVIVGLQDSQQIDEVSIRTISTMSMRLAELLNYDNNKIKEVYEYSMVLINNRFKDFKENDYDSIRAKASIGGVLVKRIQIEQKCERLCRASVEGGFSSDFMKSVIRIQQNEIADVVLLCSVYHTFRSTKAYKRPYAHQATIDIIKRDFRVVFNELLLDRFIKYNDEFDRIYKNEG